MKNSKYENKLKEVLSSRNHTQTIRKVFKQELVQINSLSGETLPQKLYNFIYGIEFYLCEHCKKNKTKFFGLEKGYQRCCSRSCYNHNRKYTKKFMDLSNDKFNNRISFVISNIPMDSWNINNEYISDFLLNIEERTSFLNKTSKLSERIYCILNEIKTPVQCSVCKKKLNYTGGLRGYPIICGNKKCANLRSSDPKFNKYDKIDYSLGYEDIQKKITNNSRLPFLTSPFARKYYETIFHLTSFCLPELDFNSRLKYIINNLTSREKCKECGKDLINFTNFCSTQCMVNNESVKNQKKETNLKRYGCTAFIGTTKSRELAIKKYSNDPEITNISQIPEIREKINQTNLNNFGHINSFQCDKSIKHRINATTDLRFLRPSDKDYDGFLYIFRYKDIFKIGISKDVCNRQQYFEKNLNEPIILIIKTKFNKSHVFDVEQFLHLKYKKYNHLLEQKISGRTEWFKLECLSNVLNEIKTIKSNEF